MSTYIYYLLQNLANFGYSFDEKKITATEVSACYREHVSKWRFSDWHSRNGHPYWVIFLPNNTQSWHFWADFG